MEEIFGLSMNVIAGVAIGLTAAIFVVLAYLAWRNPVMFKNGLRNIPRRKMQTSLIIFGLMLATVIMTAAFGTGDTVTSTVTKDVLRIADETDELITWNVEDFPAPEDQRIIPNDVVADLRERFADDDDIDALMPALSEILPVVNPTTGLNEAGTTVVAYQPEDAEGLGGLADENGDQVRLSGNQIAVNEDLADAIEAEVGQTLTLFYEDRPVEVVVAALVPNTFLSGAINYPVPDDPGGAVTYDFLVSINGQTEGADIILVSNHGDEKSGVDRSDAAVEKLEAALEGQPFEVEPIKEDVLEIAQLVGNVFTSIFIVFGLFSIAAGILLIFLIFVMLAAERKPEMGMARAVGAKRRHLVESFLAEGMGYDLGSAIVGVVLGIGVTFAMVALLNTSIGDQSGINLGVSFSARSIATAFCLGIITTFVVVFFASLQASRLNITAAIRDLPEPKPYNPEGATFLGFLRGTLNAMNAGGYIAIFLTLSFVLEMPILAVLAAVGIVGVWLNTLRGNNFYSSRAERLEGEGFPLWPFLLVPMIPFYLLAMLLVRLTREHRPNSMPMWLLIGSIVVAPAGVVVAALQSRGRPIAWAAGYGAVAAVVGVLFVIWAFQTDQASLFMTGVSLLFLFAALTLRYVQVAERFSFSAIAALLLAVWYATPAGALDFIVGDMDGGPEMFFLSGVVMVTSATFVLVYNADIVLPLIGALGNRVGRIIPAVKTAIAYPLMSRGRTGLTIAMIGLIMFSLVVFSTINENFSAVFLGDDSKGGFDVVTQVNPNNRVDDLNASLEAQGVDTSAIAVTAETRQAFEGEAEVGAPQFDSPFGSYRVIGADTAFFETVDIEINKRAAGYDSDEDVWQALAANSSLAVVNSAIEGGDGPGDPGDEDDDFFELNAELDDAFAPFEIELRDPGTGSILPVTVIGMMDGAADIFWSGIVTQRDTVIEAFPDAGAQFYYLKLNAGVDAEEFAKSVESGLVQANADSLGKILDDQRAAQSSFLLLFQGFMGLGLVVGIAALGVISFRAVVERRQQIGMLRAIGYQRSMVALSFLFESGFIALSGILMGLIMGLSFAWVLFTQNAIDDSGSTTGFIVPWVSVGVICLIAFVASMLMTLLPARAATQVEVAEALRYE